MALANGSKKVGKAKSIAVSQMFRDGLEQRLDAIEEKDRIEAERKAAARIGELETELRAERQAPTDSLENPRPIRNIGGDVIHVKS